MVSSVDQVTLGIEIGYELRTIILTHSQWVEVQSGHELIQEVDDLYEGESFTYRWHFNNPSDPESTLVITYGDGVGFDGNIRDVFLVESAK